MASRKRALAAGEGEEEGEAVPVAGGFEAPIFGARVVGQVTTLALEGEDGPPASLLRAVASDRSGGWYVTTEHSLLHVSAAGRIHTIATCEDCRGIALSPDGSAIALFVAEFGGHKIRRVEVATGAVSTLAGSGAQGSADGMGDAAQFSRPIGVAVSPDGSALFVADFGSHKIRRVEVATGAVTTVAGRGTAGSADGVVGDAAQFNGPHGATISPDGSELFVADCWNNKIRRVEVATGAVTTVAGSGTTGSADGVGGAAEFSRPIGVALSPDGSTLLVRAGGSLRQVCVAAPPPPPSFAPLVVPPSTLVADLKKMRGDASLPDGKVTFIVGDDDERIEHVSKSLLCVRSDTFHDRVLRRARGAGHQNG
ncbi:hypothetical protein EMIHUDRAFT_237929 [Emiliania huxleyi CCMP1516]|uniref:SMP-30/Gluconolactonase/LRE-like region domain-containing protein n=2 Tax=Emiliania huxleyi TaxID=2903 RepID=A0A0D3JP54_EMIH1|nr:hypothetical protein EMIHUDRAFT_237929 [Emiliania huxleyi CCMP1516]EOD25289.1 hypothetical protein EMIHUDRAFT_237929 [Emiliania huxleyi CCMP1516]|eukprot:XP_005777718.1 hypothetical protein EMIHUDRAFT_237929 [Emiliania huxleyi CCMP1516]